MRFFWGGHFEFLSRPFWIFFLLHLIEKCSPFIWGILFFCTMDGFSRILEKKLSELLCTQLYIFSMITWLICHKVWNSKFNWLYLGLWISYLCFKPECTAATAVAGAISKHTREGRGFHFHRGAEREEASSKSKC